MNMSKTKIDVCKKCWGKGRVHGGDENSTWSKTCEDCHGIGFVRVPMTNADSIRAMSDEELMQFLFNEVSNNTICSFCVPTMRTKCKCDGHCKNGILEWLKQPAEE